MRRLDELLTAATKRGDWRGPEDLIRHLERRLAGEREQVVAAQTRRAAMVTTETRPITPSEHPPPRRSRWAYAFAAFALVAVAVAASVVLLNDGGEEETAQPATQELTHERAIELVQGFAANVRNGDMEALALGSPVGTTDTDFVEWHLGMGSNAEFSNCLITSESTNGAMVACDVTFDPDSFLARATAGTTTATISVFPNELVNLVGWPPPDGLTAAAAELRTFFDARHPDLEDTVFASGGYAGMAWTRQAGETIARHLDEFIEWRENTVDTLTPTEVMARLAAAIAVVDSQIEEPLVADADDAADVGFLVWNTALGLDPEFSGCEETVAYPNSSTFRCDVTMGDRYFFSAVTGENLGTTMSATVRLDGSLTGQSWPPPQELVTIEHEFRDWIRATHPELEDRMFGTDYAGIVKSTRESGELHTQHLEEYLAYLADN